MRPRGKTLSISAIGVIMSTAFTKRLLLPLLLALTACGGGGGGGITATNSEPMPSGTTTPTSIEEALEQGVDRGVDGLFLAILRADGSITRAAAGIQNRSTGEPADPQTLFKIASISKLYIAAAAVKLAWQGQLTLDDSLASWLPDIAPRIENSGQITLRLLIQHRSGVPDFDSAGGFSWRSSHRDIDRELERILDQPADFAPNARYEYSNSNYLLLGKVLDQALGYSHQTWIQDFILSPLGLTDTYNQFRDVDPSLLARGYWDNEDVTDLEYVIPGGSMVATAEDVARFVQALAVGELFNDAERDLYRDVYWFNHSGWLPGYQSIARYERTPNAVIVLFLNNTGGVSESVLEDTYDDIARLSR